MSSIKFLVSSAGRRVFGSTGATKALKSKIAISLHFPLSFIFSFIFSMNSPKISKKYNYFPFFLNHFLQTCHKWRPLRFHFPENKNSARVVAFVQTCSRCRSTCCARQTCSACRWTCSSQTPRCPACDCCLASHCSGKVPQLHASGSELYQRGPCNNPIKSRPRRGASFLAPK